MSHECDLSVKLSHGLRSTPDENQVVSYPATPSETDVFDNSDAVFVNYNWSEERLAEYAQLAGDRKRDVYMGLDAWGNQVLY